MQNKVERYANETDLLDECEREGGVCPICGMQAELRTCHDCGKQAWIIDCGDYDQPRPLSSGRKDGSEGYLTFCEDCAENTPGGDE